MTTIHATATSLTPTPRMRCSTSRIRAPKPKPSFDSWQRTFGQDQHSLEASIEADFEADGAQLRFSCRKIPETSLPVPQLGEQTAATGLGPFGPDACKLLRDGKPVVLAVPLR